MYHNYVKDIQKKDILNYSCENPGICCNIAHFSVRNDPVDIQYRMLSKRYDIDPFGSEEDEKEEELNDGNENIFVLD